MSVFMLQTIPMNFALPASANNNIELNECIELDMIPTSLRTTLEQELQNAIEIDERTESDLFSIGTINSDGTRSLMTFSDRIKYYDTDTTNICFIDNTIIPAIDNDDIAYVNKGNSYHVCFPNKIENGLSFTNEQYTFNMKPLVGEEGVSPKIVNKDEVVYNDVFDTSTDISYALENSGIKESIIVNEYTGRSSYEFIFEAEGLTPDNTSGSSITFLKVQLEQALQEDISVRQVLLIHIFIWCMKKERKSETDSTTLKMYRQEPICGIIPVVNSTSRLRLLLIIVNGKLFSVKIMPEQRHTVLMRSAHSKILTQQ